MKAAVAEETHVIVVDLLRIAWLSSRLTAAITTTTVHADR